MKIIKPANILYLDITGIHSCNIKNQIKLTVLPCMLRNLHFFTLRSRVKVNQHVFSACARVNITQIKELKSV